MLAGQGVGMKMGRYYSAFVQYVVIFVMAFLLFTFWQLHLHFGDPDAFYHAKMAVFLSQGVILRSLPWMQFSTLAQQFTDQHFLYHLILVPLIKLGNPLLAVKLGTIIFGAGFCTMFFWFLRKINCRQPFLYTILLLLTPSLTFRLSLVKANNLSLIVLLLIVYAIIQRRYWLIAALQALYVWLYGGWILGLAVALLYWFLRWFRPKDKGRFPLRVAWPRMQDHYIPLASLVGSVTGLVLNPYWPQNVYFYWQQIYQIGVINYAGILNVGGEWLPTPLMENLRFHIYPLVLLILGLIFSVRKIASWSHQTWFLVMLGLIFTVLTFKSRRYVEMSAPFLFISAAAVWVAYNPNFSLTSLVRNILFSTQKKISIVKIYLSVFVLAFVPLFLVHAAADIFLVRNLIANSGFPLGGMQAESQWLKENAPPQAIIWHSNWDYWPMLFYFNDQNYYLVGLDPTFMYNYSPGSYFIWANINEGKFKERLSYVIGDQFKAQYVLIGYQNKDFLREVEADPDFTLAYQGPSARIFLVTKHEVKKL